MAGSPQYLALLKSHAGSHIIFLFIPSPALAFLSFILTKPIGKTSFYLIPAGLFLTVIHHTVIRILFVRKPRGTVNDGSPAEVQFKYLYHWANIWIEGLLTAVWLVGGVISIIVNIFNWKSSSPQDVAAAGVAILEAGLVGTITWYSWKLRKEAHIVGPLGMSSNLSLGAESVALVGQPRANV